MTEPIEYGSINKQSQFVGGRKVLDMTVYTQSLRVESDDEVLEAFKTLLKHRTSGLLHNPGITLEEYADSGKVKRIIKTWSVYE